MRQGHGQAGHLVLTPVLSAGLGAILKNWGKTLVLALYFFIVFLGELLRSGCV